VTAFLSSTYNMWVPSLLILGQFVLTGESVAPGVSSYIAPAGFPTSAFTSYYFLPSSPTQEPQPALYDPVLKKTYPLNLTNPDAIPSQNTDPILYPSPTSSVAPSAQPTILNQIIASVEAVLTNSNYTSNCTKCVDALVAGAAAAKLVPSLVPSALVQLCQKYKFASNSTCQVTYGATNYGAVLTQILAFGHLNGSDGQYACYSLGYCPRPLTLPLNTANLFPKPKPANVTAPKRSGVSAKVLHMSDFHLDARYSAGSEGNCSSSLCCRSNNPNPAANAGQILFPAPFYGAMKCDSPYGLGLAALQSVGPLTGTNASNPLGFTIYTGDLVSHDPENQMSREYTEYTETSVYGMFKSYLTGPVFAALGNHDTSPENTDAPYTLPGDLGHQSSWNYEHVAGLWLHENWMKFGDAVEAATHYGGYSVKNHLGLRVISFNTDFWYKSNYYTILNSTDPDFSGTFRWMIDELQKAEDKGERVWIIGHVLSGWDGSNGNPNPTNLFYQIVERYSPHVIANVFFGHTHEDQFSIFYSNNGTTQNASTALTTGWIGPSITPLTNLNSGYRLYVVDTGDFNVYDAYTFYSNVSAFPGLSSTGPTFQLEYSTRDTYGPAANWSVSDPLNATFWHQVTVAMEQNSSLVSLHNTYQGKMSTQSPNCTNSACTAAKICYMRSGSVALGSQCPQGYVWFWKHWVSTLTLI
jgi:hypothetical protein